MEKFQGWLGASLGDNERLFSTFEQDITKWQEALTEFMSNLIRKSYTSLIESTVSCKLFILS